MAKPRTFEKPTGFRDFPPPLVSKKRMIEERVQRQFIRWGYQEIYTPTLEFYDTVGSASAIPEQKMFKCMDRQGNTLVLRPDQTAPIARVVASVLKNEPLPLRLFYHSSVFRAQEHEAGRNAEFFQSGVECIGEPRAEADAEVIALAVEALKACEIQSFQLTLGHVGLLDGFIRERVEDHDSMELLKEYLGERNVVGYREVVQQLPIPESARDELHLLFEWQQVEKQFNLICALTRSPQVETAVQHLEEVWSHLEDYGVASHVTIDLSLVGSLHYYTGVYFEGYAAGQGFPLLSGGRYDRLFESFQRPTPATGFALKMDRLMESCPLESPPSERVGLLYPKTFKKQAIEKAKELRETGQIVLLQSIDEKTDPRSFARQYDRLLICREGGCQDV